MDLYSITGREETGAALTPPVASQRRRLSTFLASALLHVFVFGLAALWPVYGPLFLPDEPDFRSEIVRQQRRVLIYYPTSTRPDLRDDSRKIDVSPRAADRITNPRVRIRTPEAISIRTEADRRAFQRDQFIRVPQPKIDLQPPVPSPSAVIVQAPPAPPPPLPPPPPPPVARPQPKVFQPPSAPTRVQASVALAPEAPKSLSTVPNTGQSVPSVTSARSFLPPPPPGAKPARRELGAMEVPQAPALESAGGPSGNVPQIAGAKQFLPPPPPGAKPNPRGSAGGSGADLDAPPPTQPGAMQGMPGPQAMVVLTTNPTPGAPPPQPQGNRDARISVGSADAPGTASSRTPSGGIVAPGVVVRGAPGAKIDGSGSPPPTVAGDGSKAVPNIPSAPAARPQFNSTAAVSAPLRPGARQLSPQVEKVFAGRVVYSTVVASVQGQPDWVIWFGDPVVGAGAPAGRVFAMRPPVSEKSTLPAALPGMPAKLWVQARLTRSGTLTGIEGAAPDLAAALARWTFFPAIRNGQPADVDVLIEANWRP